MGVDGGSGDPLHNLTREIGYKFSGKKHFFGKNRYRRGLRQCIIVSYFALHFTLHFIPERPLAARLFDAAGLPAQLYRPQRTGYSRATILQETHLSNEQYGVIIACFSYAYMLGNPLWGHLLDRMGVRRGMNVAVGVWTLASAAHAWATGFWSFAAARAVLGAAEGATFPGGLRTVAQTLPPSKRGKGLAVAYSGGSLGR